MNRRSESRLQSYAGELRRSTRAATAALSTADGRWAVVSTSMTALVAGAIAMLAIGTTPPGASSSRTDHSLLPYKLFMQLAAHTGSNTSYASFAPAGTIATPAREVHNTPALPVDGAAVDEAENSVQPSTVDSRTLTLDKGDTLVGALTDAGVSQEDASAAVMAMKSVFDPRDVKAGESFDITYSTHPPVVANVISITPANLSSIDASDEDDASDAMLEPAESAPVGNLLKLTFSPSIDHEITVTRSIDGSYSVQDVVKKLTPRSHRAGATIDSSLYLAAMQAGIPADVVVDMIHMFSYKVDFQRELKPGNSFEVLYDYYYTPDGRPAKQGNIAFASMHLADRTITLYRYQPNPDEPADYFDANGQSAKGFLMKTPVDGARITSGFGMRFHPVLGYSRMHKGIDFGVPVGTPVMAAGAGTIKLEGHLGGYGNYVRVDHDNGYATAYGHLSRFAPGLHIGSRVRQGQIIAYSGNTGLSTGPHLHYEILVHGNQTNPLTVKVATGRLLAGPDRHKFLDARLRTDDVLAALPLETKLADATGDLRTAKAQ